MNHRFYAWACMTTGLAAVIASAWMPHYPLALLVDIGGGWIFGGGAMVGLKHGLRD